MNVSPAQTAASIFATTKNSCVASTSGLSPKERKQNLAASLAWDEREAKHLEGLSGAVALVDDIFTTGATMGECVRVLKEAGAASVVCVAAARTREKR